MYLKAIDYLFSGAFRGGEIGATALGGKIVGAAILFVFIQITVFFSIRKKVKSYFRSNVKEE